jgi:hypothetical protein
MRRNRKLTPTTKTPQKRTFSATRKLGLAMIEFRRRCNRDLIIGSRFDRNRSLPNCWKHFRRRDRRSDTIS